MKQKNSGVILQIFIALTWISVMTWIWTLPKVVPLRLKIHPTFMFTAYFLLFFEAYVAYKLPQYEKLEYNQKIKLHAILNTSALVIGIIGILVLFTEKGRVHLYSVHSWIGLFSTILYAVNIILGSKYRKDQTKIKIIKWHKFLGHFLFLLMCVALLSGIQNLASIMIRNLKIKKRSKYITATIGITILFIITVFFEKYQHDDIGYEITVDKKTTDKDKDKNNDEMTFEQIKKDYKGKLVVYIPNIWKCYSEKLLIDVTEWNNKHPGGKKFGKYVINDDLTEIEFLKNYNIVDRILRVGFHGLKESDEKDKLCNEKIYKKEGALYNNIQKLIIGKYVLK